MGSKVRIALYMRLSKEDEDSGGESSSIQTQRILLHQYVEIHFTEYCLSEFLDDGYSGTNMNRPGMTEMLEAVKESLLDCIIVKDFSRFSRDYIELGSYMEQVFPFMGIRFISVNDRYDSNRCRARAGELDISFRGLMYDLYSKDLSVKVKSSLAAKKGRGQFISANSPFGYEKMPGNKHMLVIAWDEAEIVRRIFQMTLSGMTSVEIAKVLNSEGIKTPIAHKIAKGKASRKPKGGEFSWSSSMICQILRNQAYTGDMVYGKTYRDAAGGRNHIKPRKDWQVYRDHHEAIVNRETFEEVQKTRGKARTQDTKRIRDTARVQGTSRIEAEVKHPLTGKMICAGCGKNLRIRSGLNPYFCCPCLYVNAKEECVRRVNLMFAEQYVLYKIQDHVEKEAAADWILEKRKEMEQQLEMLKKEQKSILDRLNALKAEKMRNYERYARKKAAGDSGRAAGEFQESLKGIGDRETEAESLLSEISQSAEALEAGLTGKKKAAGQIEALEFSELTQELVQHFIAKIVVRDEQHMTISWCDGLQKQ